MQIKKIMITSILGTFLSGGFLLINSLLYSQTNDKNSINQASPTPPLTYSGHEQGHFKILLAGKEVGYENFEISGLAENFKASGTIELTVSPKLSDEYPNDVDTDLDDEDFPAPLPRIPQSTGPPITFRVRALLRFNELFEPTFYEIIQDSDSDQIRAKVEFLPDRSQVTFYSNDGIDQRRIELQKDVTVLDENIFHHYLILAKRYDFTEGGIQEFSAFIPQQFLAEEIRVVDLGEEEIQIEHQSYNFRCLMVDTGELQVKLWLDKTYKLKKVAIPEVQVEAILQ